MGAKCCDQVLNTRHSLSETQLKKENTPISEVTKCFYMYILWLLYVGSQWNLFQDFSEK